MFYHNDNLHVMRMLSDESIDLIYLDPPFCSNRNYIKFKDTWYNKESSEDEVNTIKQNNLHLYECINITEFIHSKMMRNYLFFMTSRLIEMHRLLKRTGNILLHCDQSAGHYLKIILDSVFNKNNFRNEIIWCYKSGGASPKNNFSKKHDNIFWYSKTDEYFFNPQTEKSYNRDLKPYGFKDIKQFHDEKGYYTIVGMKDYWYFHMVGRSSKERNGYPTQKPVKLLSRIIEAHSKENDLILDPFCGSGTTLEAALNLNRKFIGIDMSKEAINISKNRLESRNEKWPLLSGLQV